MVLQKRDEVCQWQAGTGFAALLPIAKGRRLPLIGKAFGQGFAQQLNRLLIVDVVAVFLSTGDYVADVMNVIVPLRIVGTFTVVATAFEVTSLILFIFQNQMNVPTGWEGLSYL